MNAEPLAIYAQGFAQTSPDHAGIGLLLPPGSPSEEFCEYIGVATPEQAHFQAFIRALTYAKEHNLHNVQLLTDCAILLQSLRYHHCPSLSPELSSLHKRILQLAKYLQVSYAQAPSDAPQLVRARELAKRASIEMRQSEQGESVEAVGEERHALQQSAGGVVYKRVGRRFKVCLISKKDGQLWALPKGRMRPGESWEATAVREVLEETGHLATIQGYIDQIDYYFYWKENHTIYYKLVAFFLMPVVVENHLPPDGEADSVVWLDPEEAARRLHYPSERNILRQAQGVLYSIRN